MQWLMALETNEDPITTCRLMNVFRRKGVKIATLALAARPGGYSLIALVETPEADVEHIFNYLRRIEGVHNVTYYRHEPAGNASFIFIDSDEDSTGVTRFLDTIPESKLVFASHGGLASIGKVAILGLLATLLSTVVFFPAFLAFSERKKSD